MSTQALTIENVSVRFGGVTALDDVSFDVRDGELLGLIGPNGAGKTTMMRSITGVVTPQEGRIAISGRDVTSEPVHRRIRLGLALSQQLVRPFRGMSVVDNVILAAGKNRTASALSALLGRSRSAERERAMEMLALVGIADRAEDSPSNLPLGFLKRLEVARALALDPKVLMLDEPLAGLNHAEARALADTIRDINAAGRTLVLIEHNLGEVMRICHRLVVLDNGRRIGEGDPKTVMSDPVVRAAYLGEGGEDAAA
jgi:branched-chain amino acid transport system ATP-binding protein